MSDILNCMFFRGVYSGTGGARSTRRKAYVDAFRIFKHIVWRHGGLHWTEISVIWPTFLASISDPRFSLEAQRLLLVVQPAKGFLGLQGASSK